MDAYIVCIKYRYIITIRAPVELDILLLKRGNRANFERANNISSIYNISMRVNRGTTEFERANNISSIYERQASIYYFANISSATLPFFNYIYRQL